VLGIAIGSLAALALTRVLARMFENAIPSSNYEILAMIQDGLRVAVPAVRFREFKLEVQQMPSLSLQRSEIFIATAHS
jgi:hypothetical protein